MPLLERESALDSLGGWFAEARARSRATGPTASAIAHRLRISARTVHKHLERIYPKLGVIDRLGAVLRAREFHLL